MKKFFTKKRKKKIGNELFLWGFLILPGLILTTVGTIQAARGIIWHKSSTTESIQGTVVAIKTARETNWEELDPSTNEQDFWKTAFIEYTVNGEEKTYQAPYKRRTKGKSKMVERAYFKKGEIVKLYYKTEDPNEVRLSWTYTSSFAQGMLGIGLMFLPLSIVAIITKIKSAQIYVDKKWKKIGNWAKERKHKWGTALLWWSIGMLIIAYYWGILFFVIRGELFKIIIE